MIDLTARRWVDARRLVGLLVVHLLVFLSCLVIIEIQTLALRLGVGLVMSVVYMFLMWGLFEDSDNQIRPTACTVEAVAILDDLAGEGGYIEEAGMDLGSCLDELDSSAQKIRYLLVSVNDDRLREALACLEQLRSRIGVEFDGLSSVNAKLNKILDQFKVQKNDPSKGV